MSNIHPKTEAYDNTHFMISHSFMGWLRLTCIFSPGLIGGLPCISVMAGVECLTVLHSSVWPFFPRGELYTIDFCVAILRGSLTRASVVVQGFKRNEWSSGPNSEVLEYHLFHILVINSTTGSPTEGVSSLGGVWLPPVICVNYKHYTHWLFSTISVSQVLSWSLSSR